MHKFNTLRTRNAPTKLKKDVFVWWLLIPEEVRPVNLAKEYPHIVVKIVETWDDFYTCEQYIHNLLHERDRAGREGFRAQVRYEIRLLYNTLLRRSLGMSKSETIKDPKWLN